MKDADLHEALITKGMVKGVDTEGYINSQFNCIIRYHDVLGCTHTGGVGGDDDFEKSVRHLVRWEGAENVRRWLQGAKVRWPTIGAEVLRRFDSIVKDQSNDS